MQIINTRDIEYVPTTAYCPIFQIEMYIGALRKRGVPEDELEQIREKNKYIPPPPKKYKLKQKKSVIYDIDDIFVPPVVVVKNKKKVLRAVVKKI